ncbi:hypothetical protein LCGC14_2216890 [marine sediment metagenome]|uniref:Uncharacterized protein n=1 Tax=marine sediment metagenome TaxID=412755 RepID=A0A0F9FPW5_9ZZZZ
MKVNDEVIEDLRHQIHIYRAEVENREKELDTFTTNAETDGVNYNLGYAVGVLGTIEQMLQDLERD